MLGDVKFKSIFLFQVLSYWMILERFIYLHRIKIEEQPLLDI